jgi:hypothetical protein
MVPRLKPKTKPRTTAAAVRKAAAKPKPKEKSIMTTDSKPDPKAHTADKPHPGHVENRDHDPKHPANTTLSPSRPAVPRPAAETFGIPPEDLLTEQEKDAMAGGAASDGNVPGVGPAEASEESPGPVETIEDQGIGPKTPYPTGNPPVAGEEVKAAPGAKGRKPNPRAPL